jgi:cation diffusion facilitator CzcD-associated flavoprotein CzcO
LIKYKTEVTSATWDEKESVWVIETRKTPPFPRPGEESSDVTEDVQTYRARFLLLGTGVLSLPKMPTDIPGLKDFKGPSCHSANYNLGDLTGKRVALIGTGATG